MTLENYVRMKAERAITKAAEIDAMMQVMTIDTEDQQETIDVMQYKANEFLLTSPAFRLGYKLIFSNNEWIFEEDENALGTKNDPIEYYDGVALVDGAYYIKDGISQVYKAGEWIES